MDDNKNLSYTVTEVIGIYITKLSVSVSNFYVSVSFRFFLIFFVFAPRKSHCPYIQLGLCLTRWSYDTRLSTTVFYYYRLCWEISDKSRPWIKPIRQKQNCQLISWQFCLWWMWIRCS